MTKYKVIISAPYMQPVVDRFLGVFKDEGCDLIIPTVNERLDGDMDHRLREASHIEDPLFQLL